MNKKLIALAVAGLVSGGAFAQSNVTMYGRIDLGYEHVSGGGKKSTGINCGAFTGCRLGFKGSETLGNGLKANFQLEYSVFADVNSGVGTGSGVPGYSGLRNRIGMLQLAGDFGALSIGNLNTPGNEYGDKYDAMGTTNAFSLAQGWAQNHTFKFNDPASGYVTGVDFASVLSSSAHANTIRYDAPAFGGFTFKGAYAFAGGNVDDNKVYSNSQERFYDIGVDYDIGPFSAGFFSSRTNHVGNSTGYAKEEGFGASFDFGMAKLFGRFDRFEQDTTPGAGLDAKKRLTTLGISAPFGNNSLALTYARLTDKLMDDADSTGWGIQMTHPLSKRTFIYGGYSHASNDTFGTARVPGGTGSGANGSVDPGAGINSTGYGFGIVHSF